MPIVLPEEQAYELPPAGSHTATCIRVVDLGTQSGVYGPKWQVLISWELRDEQMADGRPFTISRRYTFSGSRKSTLREHLEGWFGRVLTAADLGKFDLAQLLGSTCLIGIKHEIKEDGRTFANVTSVMKRPKAVPERLSCNNEPVAFSLTDRPLREDELQKLPQWVRDTVMRSPEYTEAIKPQKGISTGTQQRLKGILADSPAPKPQPAVENLEDSIPF
jgi:hypothetical protein